MLIVMDGDSFFVDLAGSVSLRLMAGAFSSPGSPLARPSRRGVVVVVVVVRGDRSWLRWDSFRIGHIGGSVVLSEGGSLDDATTLREPFLDLSLRREFECRRSGMMGGSLQWLLVWLANGVGPRWSLTLLSSLLSLLSPSSSSRSREERLTADEGTRFFETWRLGWTGGSSESPQDGLVLCGGGSDGSDDDWISCCVLLLLLLLLLLLYSCFRFGRFAGFEQTPRGCKRVPR